MFPIKIAICGYPLFSDKPKLGSGSIAGITDGDLMRANSYSISKKGTGKPMSFTQGRRNWDQKWPESLVHHLQWSENFDIVIWLTCNNTTARFPRLQIQWTQIVFFKKKSCSHNLIIPVPKTNKSLIGHHLSYPKVGRRFDVVLSSRVCCRDSHGPSDPRWPRSWPRSSRGDAVGVDLNGIEGGEHQQHYLGRQVMGRLNSREPVTLW